MLISFEFYSTLGYFLINNFFTNTFLVSLLMQFQPRTAAWRHKYKTDCSSKSLLVYDRTQVLKMMLGQSSSVRVCVIYIVYIWTNLFKQLVTKCTKGTAQMKEHRVFLLYSIFLVFLYKSISPLPLPVICLDPPPHLPPPHHHQCHISLRPLLLSSVLPHPSLFLPSPAQFISLHLLPPLSSLRCFVNTVRWPALTRSEHTAVPTSPQWPFAC